MGEILTEDDWVYILRNVQDPQCKAEIRVHLQTYEADRARTLHVDEGRRLGPFSEARWNVGRSLMAQIVEEYAAAINIKERRVELSTLRESSKGARRSLRVSIISAAIAGSAAIAAWIAVFTML